MNTPPRIFVSAVSRELRLQRELVARTLRFLGCEAVIQDDFGTEQGNLRQMLAEKVKSCDALIQLVGHAFGQEIRDAQHPAEVMSYTHYEAHYAAQQGKIVWYILIDDGWHLPLLDEEEKELAIEHPDALEDQRSYRRRVRKSPNPYYRVANDAELELCIFKMLVELEKLRSQKTPWLHPEEAAEPVPALRPTDTKALAREILDVYLQAFPEIRKRLEGEEDETAEEQLIVDLARRRGRDPKRFRTKLHKDAGHVQNDHTQPLLKRAQAAYARREYAEAARLARAAAAQAGRQRPQDTGKIVRALELAGWSASERRQDEIALKLFRRAVALTDPERDRLERARVQYALAVALHDRGKYLQVQYLLKGVIAIHTKRLGAAHPETLKTRHALAVAHDSYGNHARAEKQLRRILRLREKALGKKHADTLLSRHQLAVALYNQQKYREAEREQRMVLRLQETVIGPEHADTLATRMALANAMSAQGKCAEAEPEHRLVLKIRTRLFGRNHPDTLRSVYHLARCLRDQNKINEARRLAGRAYTARLTVLGRRHPRTVQAAELYRELAARIQSGARGLPMEKVSAPKAIARLRPGPVAPEARTRLFG